MSTFTTYNTLIEQRLANQSETFFTAEMKRLQCNKAIEDILNRYDLPEMTKRTTVAFTTGVGSKPSDFFRAAKLWDVDSDGIETNVYDYIPEANFDALGLNDSYYWTEDYLIASAARKLLVRPQETITLQLRYIKANTEMTDDSTDSGLTSRWDEAVALWTCYRLLNNDGSLNEAQQVQADALSIIQSAFMATRDSGGFKSGKRLKSRFERIDYLNR